MYVFESQSTLQKPIQYHLFWKIFLSLIHSIYMKGEITLLNINLKLIPSQYSIIMMSVSFSLKLSIYYTM